MPWEVLCLDERYDPVTTEPFGVRLWILPLVGKSASRARRGPSVDRTEVKA